MSRSLQWLLFLGLACGTCGAAEPFAPDCYPLDRYEHIWSKSPFVVEAPVVQQSDGLEKRFALTGIASAGGNPLIFVFDRQSLSRIVVQAGEPNSAQLELVSVSPDMDLHKSSAVVRLGAQQATISYDAAMLANINQDNSADAKNSSSTASGSSSNPVSSNQVSELKQQTAANLNSPASTTAKAPSPNRSSRRQPIRLH